MVLEGLRKSIETSTVRDLGLEQVLAALGKPAVKHEVWDITVHQHTFTLERHPDGSNMLIQSYQPGYNVQHWCGLEDPYVDGSSFWLSYQILGLGRPMLRSQNGTIN